MQLRSLEYLLVFLPDLKNAYPLWLSSRPIVICRFHRPTSPVRLCRLTSAMTRTSERAKRRLQSVAVDRVDTYLWPPRCQRAWQGLASFCRETRNVPDAPGFLAFFS